MSSIKKAYFNAPDGQLHYRFLLTTQSPKKAPCVFLHIFGSSYDPETQPPNTAYYVDVFMQLFNSLNLTKFHLLGHHSGASLATELAALYPTTVLTLCLVGTAIMTRSEQIALNTLINIPLNEPIASGAHLQKTWDYLASHGDMWGFFGRVRCETMAMCARDDVLWPYVENVREIKPEARVEEVKGGDFETGRPDSVVEVAELHFDFLGNCGF
ncbi:alpha/beta-hydrolase [Hyaloscypha bicolor E]|uniref:Alpha/beta-hydrolase n=1 Tax=Hyaloscypha bicolor E TaxID=1095630 RepID=A0A2J6T445_9HELO|nr:alpha/beta-hydrolase [Hyaloscypha bicolor E]PMD57787.1 alpha/beta-hydrolase [Hyaloscypha bicolor E]